MASGSPPDLSQLSLSSQSRQLHDPNAGYDYDPNSRLHQFATSPPIPAQSQYHHNPLAMNPSPMKTKTMRGALPSQWLDSAVGAETRSMSPNDASDFSSSGGSPQLTHPLAHLQASQGPIQPSTSPNPAGDDEIIPTAIVIKNIPFNVKRETLLDIIASLSIPTPYAFNYHLDPQGAFRGLAFANFRQAVDADAVVAALNGFDVQGRKLRVEYKKVLQAGEKERIEREKALRRMRSMQLEKEQQQAQQPPPQAQPQSAAAQYDEFGQSISSGYPAPPQRSYSTSSYHQQQQQQQYSPPGVPAVPPLPSVATFPGPSASPPVVIPADVKNSELDLNDSSTLEIYSRILLFKDDRMRDELAFSRTLSPKQRRVVHLIAQKLGVYHYSVGEGEERYAVVTRIDPNRAQRVPHTLSRAPSAYLNSSQGSLTASAALRSKKSMPDMKTLHTQAPRLTTRASNGNIREGYATIASPSRRSPGGFGALFGNTAGGSNGSAIPPVPTLPSTVTGSLNGGAGVGLADSPTSAGVVRQPRGPGVGGFGARSTRAIGSENAARGGAGLEARSHEPLEI